VAARLSGKYNNPQAHALFGECACGCLFVAALPESTIMRRLLSLLLALLLSLSALGCGGDRERGKNTGNQIKPREGPNEGPVERP
jgi:hypothetical protein